MPGAPPLPSPGPPKNAPKILPDTLICRGAGPRFGHLRAILALRMEEWGPSGIASSACCLWIVSFSREEELANCAPHSKRDRLWYVEGSQIQKRKISPKRKFVAGCPQLTPSRRKSCCKHKIVAMFRLTPWQTGFALAILIRSSPLSSSLGLGKSRAYYREQSGYTQLLGK